MPILFLLITLFTSPAISGESQIHLKEDMGKENIISQCSICHSADYITMHAQILDRSGWEKTVNKMITVMGAPINDTDKKIIIDYLVKNYGK
jgi:cytochrome c5